MKKCAIVIILVFISTFVFAGNEYTVQGVGSSFQEAFEDGIRQALIKSGKLFVLSYENYSEKVTFDANRDFQVESRILNQAFSFIEDYTISEIEFEAGFYKLTMRVFLSEGDSSLQFNSLLGTDYSEGPSILEKLFEFHKYPLGMWKINNVVLEETQDNNDLISIRATVVYNYDRYEKMIKEIISLLQGISDSVIIEILQPKQHEEGFRFSSLMHDPSIPFSIRIIRIREDGSPYLQSFMFRESNNMGRMTWQKLEELSEKSVQSILRVQCLDSLRREVFSETTSVSSSGTSISGVSSGLRVTQQIPNTVLISPGMLIIRTGSFSVIQEPLEFVIKETLSANPSGEIVTVKASFE